MSFPSKEVPKETRVAIKLLEYQGFDNGINIIFAVHDKGAADGQAKLNLKLQTAAKPVCSFHMW